MSLHNLKQQIEHSESNDISCVADDFDHSERRRLLDEISILKTRILNLEHAADTDPLVPIYNHRAFMREIERAQTMMDRYDIPSCVVFFDLNQFKSINDQYGHVIGDEMLTKIGTALKASIRDCDMVARMGGDEFAVLLFKTDATIAQAKAASLACVIADQKIEVGTKDIHLSAAWGVSMCYPKDTAKQILDRADRAMYTTKP